MTTPSTKSGILVKFTFLLQRVLRCDKIFRLHFSQCSSYPAIHEYWNGNNFPHKFTDACAKTTARPIHMSLWRHFISDRLDIGHVRGIPEVNLALPGAFAAGISPFVRAGKAASLCDRSPHILTHKRDFFYVDRDCSQGLPTVWIFSLTHLESSTKSVSWAF